MASSSLEQMSKVQQGEENKVEEIIGGKTASQYRKELTENKTVRGELGPEQRAFRERKLAAYDEKMKADGKRVCLGKWTKQLSSIQADTTAIRADTAEIKADTSAIKKGLKEAKDEISNKVEDVGQNVVEQVKASIGQTLRPLPSQIELASMMR